MLVVGIEVKLAPWDGGDRCSYPKCRKTVDSGQGIQITRNGKKYLVCWLSWVKMCQEGEKRAGK